MIFIPIFAIYRKKAIVYFAALVQHSLIGDYVAGRSQLLWPISTQYFGTGIEITSQTNIAVEWTVFAASVIIMLKAKDMAKLLLPQNSNLILAIPTFTVLLPTLASFPLTVSPWLIPPHVIYMLMFIASMIIAFPKFVESVSSSFLRLLNQLKDIKI